MTDKKEKPSSVTTELSADDLHAWAQKRAEKQKLDAFLSQIALRPINKLIQIVTKKEET